MAQIGEISVKISVDLSQFKAAIGQAQQAISQLGDEMKTMGNEVGKNFDKVGTSSTQMASKMQQSTATAGSAFSRFNGQLQKTSQGMREMGARWRQTGEGMVDFSENVMQGVTLPLALIGGIAIKSAGDIDRMFSVLNAKVGGSATKMKELTPIVQQVFRDGLGKNLNEVAMIAGHAREKLGTLNTTQLSGVINSVASLSTILGIDAVGAIDEAKMMMSKFGVTSTQAMDLIAAGFKTSDLSGKNLSATLAQVKGRAEAVTNIAKGDTWVQFAAQWRQVQAALKPVGDVLARLALEYLPAVVAGIQSFSNWFTSLSSGAQLAVVGLAALAAIIPIITLTLGALIMMGGAVVGAFGAIGTALAGITAPVWGVIAAVALLTTAFVIAYNKFAWFRDGVSQAWTAIQTAVTTAITQIVAFLQPAVTAVTEFVLQQWNRIKNWWSQNGAMIVQAAQNVWNFLKAVITGAMQVIWSIMQFIWPAIQFIIETVWENIKGVISGALGVIMSIINIFAALFTGNWSALWENVKSLLSNALTLIWNLLNLLLIGKALMAIKSFGTKALAWVSKSWASIWNTIKTFLTNIVNGIKTKFNAAKTAITNALNQAKSKVDSVFNAIKSKITSAINAVANTIKSRFSRAVSAVQSAGNRIKNILSGLASQAAAWGRNLVNMFAAGVQSAGARVIAAAKNIAAKVKSYLGFSSPTKLGPASDSDTWGPNFMKMFAAGINSGVPKLKTTVDYAASVLASGLNSPSATTTPMGNTNTVNIYPQKVDLNPNQLMRELDRVKWLNGGRYA